MKKFGLIGNPITHSKSPDLFAAAYPTYPFTYSLIEADTVEQAMDRFLSEGYTGINVTAPFKDSVFKYITHPDRVSSLLGSANIVLRKGGHKEELHSYNSDYYGVKNTINQLRSHSLHSIEQALVIGAGGAGKAAALALKDLGIKTFLANRTPAPAIEFITKANASDQAPKNLLQGKDPADNSEKDNLLQTYDLEFIPLLQIPQYAAKCRLIIYSLSFKLEEMEHINLSGKIIFEANYAHPQLDPQMKPQGNPQTAPHDNPPSDPAQQNCDPFKNSPAQPYLYISGKYWLYNQAIPAFQLFTGVDPNTEAMRNIICL
ncbi:MAG: hypothetical protein RR555_08075 [Bacteroidales bacterium]